MEYCTKSVLVSRFEVNSRQITADRKVAFGTAAN
jgi:hypothetical protein